MHKARYISKFDEEELVWPAQSPQLNLINDQPHKCPFKRMTKITQIICVSEPQSQSNLAFFLWEWSLCLWFWQVTAAKKSTLSLHLIITSSDCSVEVAEREESYNKLEVSQTLIVNNIVCNCSGPLSHRVKVYSLWKNFCKNTKLCTGIMRSLHTLIMGMNLMVFLSFNGFFGFLLFQGGMIQISWLIHIDCNASNVQRNYVIQLCCAYAYFIL